MADYSAGDIVQIITALSSLATAVGGTWIAIRQASIGKKIDEAKVTATVTAAKVQESADNRSQQLEELKKTVVDKVEEVRILAKNGKGD